jgi:hypothetical protein
MLRRRLALAAAVALAVFLAAELVARATRDWPILVGNLPSEPDLGYHMAPFTQGNCSDARGPASFRLNSLGFRGPELPEEGAPRVAGKTRILFVGDSFMTPSLRDEELIQTVCTKELGERGIEAEAFTLCCNDYSTSQELLLLERHGERVHPDVVVLEVYPMNDVGGNGLELAGLVETCAGDYVRPYVVPDGDGLRWTWAQPVRSFLRRHLMTFALLDRAMISRASDGGPFAWYAPWPLPPLSQNKRLKMGLGPAERCEIFLEHAPDHPWEHAWQITERLLLTMAERARLLGARFLALIVPAMDQVELNAATYGEDLWVEQGGGAKFLAAFDRSLPERRLAAFSLRTGVEMRLLLEPLRDQARDGKTNYLGDAHLNGRGCALGGKITADWIAGSDAFPAARPGSPLSSPTRLVPPDESAPRLLELNHEYEPMLAMGWYPYLDERSGRIAWAAGQVCAVLLPLRSRDRLIVKGWLPPHANLPSTITVQTGRGSATKELETAGPFEVQLEVSGESDGRLTRVQLEVSRTFSPGENDWRPFGAFITSIELRAPEEHAPGKRARAHPPR